MDEKEEPKKKKKKKKKNLTDQEKTVKKFNNIVDATSILLKDMSANINKFFKKIN